MSNKTTGSATRLVCAALRLAEVVCGSVSLINSSTETMLTPVQVVLIVMALLLRNSKTQSLDSFSKEVFISLSISSVSVVIALLFLPSLNVFFRYFLLDLVLSIIWFAAFALLLMIFTKTSCQQGLAAIGAIATGGACNSQRAAWGFSFLSGGLWLVSFVVGFWALRKNKKARAGVYQFRAGRTSVTIEGK